MNAPRPNSPRPYVVAVTATYRRPRELARLLNCLSAAGDSVQRIIVVDNAADGEVKRIVEESVCAAHYVSAPENLGCGGGLKLGEETAWKLAGERLTHLLILDDDVVLPCGAIDQLLAAMTHAGAAAAYPVVLDERGKVEWLPGLLDVSRRQYHRLRDQLPAFRLRCPPSPLYFTWAPGVCLLIAGQAVQAAGFHRNDFWVRGEDVDFSLRITAQGRGLFVPEVVVEHLPPPGVSIASKYAEYLKHCAMLQNAAFIGHRLSHGRSIRKTIPGNVVRLLRTWGGRSLHDAFMAFWRGAVLGLPAGAGSGDTFRTRFAKLASAKG